MQILLLHQQILLQSERLRDLHRSLMMHTSPVPAAEMENLLQEIRNLYNLALQLNNENAIQLLNDIQLAANAGIKTNAEIKVPQSNELSANINGHSQQIADKTTNEKSAETPQKIVAKAEEAISKNRLSSDIHERYHDAPTHANRFSDHQTLREKIAGNDHTKTVSDNLKTPVKDIKSAIGLNEKFQFINHLFNGDAKKYNAFIDELNISPSSESAMKAIKEISESNDWESHAAAARTFIDVVERRFS